MVAFRVSTGLLIGSLLAAAPASAATFVVNNTGNGADLVAGNGVCLTGGGFCTLLAAIQEANALPGADVINFNIAGMGPHTISPTPTTLLIVTSQVTIDGTTEPDYVTLGYPAIEISGAVAGANNTGITLNFASSSNSIIRGLAINRFNGAGIYLGPDGSSSSGNVFERCHLGTDPAGTTALGNVQHGIELRVGSQNNVIGGVLGVSGNVISGNGVDGVRIFGSTGNRVIGNIVGLDRTGTVEMGNGRVGVTVGVGSTNTNVGEAGTGRNIISGNDEHGVRIVDPGTNNNRVQNNYIGVDISGTLERGNGGGAVPGDGIRLEAGGAASGNIIGGALGLGNVISGNRGSSGRGILVLNSMTGTLIVGNIIGRSWDGSAAIPNFGPGVLIVNSSNHTIGGPGANDPNVIASNGGPGIAVTPAATGNRFQQNSIFANGGLGIDLNLDGVTPNDIDDLDVGPNGLQNFVVLSAAQTNGAGSLNVAGSLNNSPTSTYRVEFFASAAADPSGHGEGERYLGFTSVVTNGAGNAAFGVTLAASVVAGEFITGTVTSTTNTSSEFSGAIPVVGNLIVTTTADTVDGNTTSVATLIAAPGGDGRISLREAILATNATAGADTIEFGIPLTDANHLYYRNDSVPGSLSLVAATTRAELDIADFDPDYPAGLTRSWYRIQPTSALPTITDSVQIAGSSQPGFVSGGPVVELDGSSAGATVDGLRITAGSSAVRGLAINGFSRDGLRLSGPGAYSVTANYIGTDASGTKADANAGAGIVFLQLTGGASTVGGTTSAARNVISGNAAQGILLDGSALPGVAQVRIQGNYIGTDVTGAAGLNAQTEGIDLQFTGGHVIGGSGPGEGNVISGNAGFAIDVNGNALASGTASNNNLIEGNLVGTNAAGTGVVANSATGIIMYGVSNASSAASNNVIRGNVIGGAGLGSAGIYLEGNADGNLIENNFIGTDSGGTLDFGNTGNGVQVQSNAGFLATGNTVRGNVIRFNDADGVRILGDSSVTVTQNQVWTNGGLGINLGSDGVTANDAGDVDGGPNTTLNFPSVAAAWEAPAGSLTVSFGLDLAAGWYRVEFFKNPSGADPSGNGEGQVFAGSVNVNHLGSGTQYFPHTFPGVAGEVITTTTTVCTDGATCAAFSDTSELGNAFIVATAVTLTSFTAVGLDTAVDVSWKTASELNNLGFHLYRARSTSGPFERITEALIPGLGSSPSGASYSHQDLGLTNGVTYFYQLEDIETTGRTTLHGPVSGTPDEKDASASDDGRVTHGDPSEVSLRILERGPKGALIELVTGGFFATPASDGTFRLEVPGFEELDSVALPVKRTWLEAVAGRGVRVAAVEAFEVKSLAGLQPSSGGTPEIVATPEGTVKAGMRRGRGAVRGPGIFPPSAARVVETGFQEEVKKALVELAPLRWDGGSRRLLWARRLQVRLSFASVESSERSSGGSRGRRHREEKDHRARRVLAQVSTSEPGLYRVRLEDVLPARSRSLPGDSLRLSRLGESVPYHLKSSALYFVGAGEAVYELESGSGGRTMPVQSASPSGGPSVSSYLHREEWEQERYYQAGLLEAPSLWLWDVVLSPGSKSYPFTLGSLAEREAKLEVYLQGASDFEGSPDHHVRLYVNGSVVGDASWDGKTATTLEVPLAPGVLRAGENEITLENVSDTGASYSMVFLDRFAVTYRRQPVAEAGVLWGVFGESGTVAVEALGEGSLVVETAPETTWLRGTAGGAFRVEAGRSYLAVSPEAVLEARVRRPSESRLRGPRNRADYLLIAPREFLATAEPLLQRRRSQKLVSRAVAVEEIYDEFGYGEARPEAVKEFLEYVYHHWQKPSVRYVVLLGDATYDHEDHLKTGVENHVPTPLRKTSYLWTASDPSYAAVNGDDGLPDFALGRLPAASADQARTLVEKLLAYEESGRDLSGPAVLVADDPDAAGDFEKDSDDIAAKLTGRDVERIYLRELGRARTRSAILESLDRGAFLLSYVGHGGIALWASENVFESEDVDALRSQARQPIAMTMNCLNGYFHFPYFDSLAEALVKAEAKGAVAAFSPSGLSLNAPAHLYQRALVDELTSTRHQRLGDAILAAQRTYAESGAFPELLTIYHLFGDPALSLR